MFYISFRIWSNVADKILFIFVSIPSNSTFIINLLIGDRLSISDCASIPMLYLLESALYLFIQLSLF